ncbi:MAG: DUF1566 domain-containing protein [Nitrospinaceae bacterium]
MSDNDRFHDNPNGVISDEENGKEWLPKDSYQDLGVWRNWHEAQDYIRLMRQIYAGGHSDWRFPTREEALSLYDPNLKNKDLNGKDIHIHPVFVSKCSCYIWTSEVNEKDQALRVNLRDGTTEFIDKTIQEHQATRLVRDGSPKPQISQDA